MAIYVLPSAESDPIASAALTAEASTRAAADTALTSALATLSASGATDAELAAAVATLTSALAGKQDAATAATDAELATAVAAVNATAATDTELATAVATINAALAGKQDASSAATDIELAAEAATRAAADVASTAAMARGYVYLSDQNTDAKLGVSWLATDVSITAAANVVTSPTLAAHAVAGMVVLVEYAGPFGATTDLHSALIGEVGAVNAGAGTFTLVARGTATPLNASFTQTAGRAFMCWDDTAKVSAWLDAANTAGKVAVLDADANCGLISKTYAPRIVGLPGKKITPVDFGNWTWIFAPAAGAALDLVQTALTADLLTGTSTLTVAAVPASWHEGDLLYLWTPTPFWTGLAAGTNVTTGAASTGGQATLVRIERIMGATSVRLLGAPSFDFTLAAGAKVQKVVGALDRPSVAGLHFENRMQHRSGQGFLQMNFADSAVIDVSGYGNGGGAVLLYDSYEARVGYRGDRGYDADVGYSGAFGYGVSTSGACANVDIHVQGAGLRHAASVLGSSSQVRVTGIATGCVNTSWDCHEATADISFDCVAINGKGPGFIARGRRVKITGLVQGCTTGAAVYNTGSVANTDTSANDVDISALTVRGIVTGPYGNYSAGVHVFHSYATGAVVGGVTFKRVAIRNCLFEDLPGPAVDIDTSGVEDLVVRGNVFRNVCTARATNERCVIRQSGDSPINRAQIDSNYLHDTAPGASGPLAWLQTTGPCTEVNVGANNATNITASLPLIDDTQWLAITGAPTGGTFKLDHGGQVTANITFSTTAATTATNIQTALRALASIGVSGVTVTAGVATNHFLLRFALAGAVHSTALIVNTAALTGGTSPAVTPRTAATVGGGVTLTDLATQAELDAEAAARVAADALAIPLTQKAATSGVPSLDGSSRVVQSPKLHAVDHQPGGADALAIDAAAATGSLRTLGTGVAQAAQGSVQAAHQADTANPHAVTKGQVGLGFADNTADTTKPVSTAQQTALDLKAPLASPALTGSPTAPTQSAADASTKVATTAYVDTAGGLLVPKSVVDAKGDLLAATADNTVVRKAVGANETSLIADSAQADGLRWAYPRMSLQQRAVLPTGSVAEGGFGRGMALASQGILTSGTLRLGSPMVLPANVAVNTIRCESSNNAAVTPTNQWFCLVRVSDRAVLAKTADDLTTAWAAFTAKTLTLTASYTPTADELVWAGVMVAAGTIPTLYGWTVVNAALGGLAPAMGGNSTTGLTTPASLGSTATAPGAAGLTFYALVA